MSTSSRTAQADGEAPFIATVTPCIGVCVMGGSGFCRGCARSLEEIAGWTSLSHSARLSSMAELSARKSALGLDSSSLLP